MPKPLRILVLEDSEADAALMLRELRAAGLTFEAVRVDSEESFARALSPAVDLVLADYTLPDFDGGRALATLKASGLDVPFLLVTRTLEEEEAVTFMLQGAFAAVLKDRLGGLAPLVTRALEERELRRENRRIHETLEAEVSLRRTIEDAMTAGLVSFDARGKINHVNRAFCDLVGYSREELLGMAPPFPFWGTEGQSEFGAQFRNHLETGEGPRDIEAVGRRRGGGRLEVDVQVSVVAGKEGTPEGLVCLVSDIAEKRRMEEGARRARRALMTLSRCNEALVRSTSEEELFHRVCEAAVAQGGYRMAWVGLKGTGAGKPVAMAARAGHESGYLETAAITWGDDERGRGPTGSAVRTGAVVVSRDIATDPRMEPWRREALKRGYLSSIALPLKEGAEVFGALTLFSNEKDAFDSEELHLLCDLADDLAYGVAAMRAQAEKRVLQERALHAQKLDSVGTLAGGVAHDFNNILMVILANCGFLLSSFSEEDPRRADLEEVRAAAERAAGLTRQLLIFSRRQASNPEVLDLNALLRNLQKMLRRLIGEHIAVKEELCPEPVRVLADPGQLEQIVTNLAVNARDAMPSG
ncbi:PAS domain S-box protein, partial [bacterium]